MEETLFGKILNAVQSERRLSRLTTVAELWKRNKLNPNADGYKLAETKIVNRAGAHITEYRLYKLIDSSVVTISSEVTAKVEAGFAKLPENK